MSMSNGVTGGIFATLEDLQASKPRENTRVQCIERGNAEYIVQPQGYVASFGDVTTATLVAKLVINNATTHVSHFGAVGSGDESTELQEAINAIDAIGGGVVEVSEPLYQVSASLTSNKGTLLRAPVRTDIGSNTNGTNGATVKTLIRWIGTSNAGAIYTIEPVIVGDAVWGGGVENIEFDCNNLIARGIYLNNTKYSLVDAKVRQATQAGLVINSLSGSAFVFSSDNKVKSFEYIWGTQAATENSIGILIQGNGSTIPSTQQHLGAITGIVKNGYMVQIEESDNCHIDSILAPVQSPGTGGGLWIRDVGFGPSNNIDVRYLAGKLKFDDTVDIYGTSVLNYGSEGGGIISGTNARWDGELTDYVKGKRFKSHTYALREKHSITSGEFLGSSSGIAAFALSWNARTLNGVGVSDVSVIIPNKYNYANGVIEGIELVMGNNAVASGNYRLVCKTSTGVAAGPVVTPDSTLTETVAAPDQYTPTVHTFDINPDIAFNEGDHLFLTIQRLGADALDTNTDDLFILGARVLYKSLGPDSAGSGTYDIPEW